MNNQKIFNWFFIVCICIGILLRFYNLRDNSQFTWDQESSLAYPARDILINHHFPLIGPKTGVGDLYLSPFYSYQAAFFYWVFNMNPIAGAVSAGVFSLLIMFVGYLLINKNFDRKTALYFVLLWSVAPFILTQDRIPWNVNLFPLAALLIFIGLHGTFSEQQITRGLYIGLGFLLGMSSHFSILYFFLLFILLTLFDKKLKDRRIFIIVLMFIFIGLLPLLIFNFRHGNILFHNFETFISRSTSVHAITAKHFFEVLDLQMQLIGKILTFDSPVWLKLTVALIFLVSLWVRRNEMLINKYIRLFIPIFLIYLLLNFFYTGSLPEYYFIGLITVAVLGWGLLISRLEKSHPQMNILISTIAAVFLVNSYIYVNQINSNSFGVKQDIANSIKAHAQGKPVAVIYDMDLGWSFGYGYMFDIQNLNITKKYIPGHTYWLSHPISRFPGTPDKTIGDVAIGFPQTTDIIFLTKELNLYNGLMLMRIPKQLSVLSCPSVDYDAYLLTHENEIGCHSQLYNVKIENIPNCKITDYGSHERIILDNGMYFYKFYGRISDSNAGEELNTNYITSLEENRCVIFSVNITGGTSNVQTEELLRTIRLKSK